MSVTQVEVARRGRFGKLETPSREEDRQELRSAHLQSPNLALSKALWRVDMSNVGRADVEFHAESLLAR